MQKLQCSAFQLGQFPLVKRLMIAGVAGAIGALGVQNQSNAAGLPDPDRRILDITAEINSPIAEITNQEFIPLFFDDGTPNFEEVHRGINFITGEEFIADTLLVDENAFGLGGPTGPVQTSGVAWFDLVVNVTRGTEVNGESWLLVDKRISNNTGIDWNDFHITLGWLDENDEFTTVDTDVDGNPIPSPFFKAAQEEPGNPFDCDDPTVSGDQLNLWFFNCDIESPNPGNTFNPWVGITIPDAKFVQPFPGASTEVATIVLRQHATVGRIPEPSSVLGFLVLGGLGLGLKRKKQS